jgi:Type II secretion system (T2SS), protein G
LSRIVPPIFIWDPGDLTICVSVEEALREVEAVDVAGGLYTAYDADGRLLALTAIGVRRGAFGGIDQSKAVMKLQAAEEDPTHQPELEAILREYLAQGGAVGKADNTSANLPELIVRALARYSEQVRLQRSMARRRTLGCLGTLVGALLLGMAAVSLHGTQIARQRTDNLERSTLEALEMFRRRTGHYPSTEEGFAPLIRESIFDRAPTDAWGQPLLYKLEDGVPVITSLGADGKPGGGWFGMDLVRRGPAR